MEKITMEQYKYLLPMNEKHGKWLDDKITAMRIYQPFLHLFEEVYYKVYKRDGKWRIISENYEESFEGMLELIKEKTVTFTDNITSKRFKISFSDNQYQINDREMTPDAENLIFFRRNMINNNWETEVNMLVEFVEKKHFFDDEVLRIYLLNTEGDNPKIGDIFLITDISESNDNPPGWRKIVESNTFIDIEMIEKELIALCLYTPQLEFFAVDIVLTSDGFKMIQMYSNPAYPGESGEAFGAEINDYLYGRFQEKKQYFLLVEDEKKQQEVKERREYVEKFYPKGFYPYLESSLTFTSIPNFDEPLTQDSWAIERGFLPYRLAQYGIKESNHWQFISDFEYEYLGHINPKYRMWFEDKLTIKYILKDFSECLPAYYYSILTKRGKNRIISLMDCLIESQASFGDIFQLVREKGILALKPDEGTHGVGFLKFSYLNGAYYLNEEEVTEGQVMILLNDVNNQYLVTEFIEQHSDIARIYSGSVNTARLTVFKKDGKTAQIGNGYIRFGTSETGGVDNIGAGGIGANIDISTGYYCHAVKLGSDGKIKSCFKHPDTDVLIEGYLPNWGEVVQKVLRIANSMPEIEYMGFDVAFTEEGIKLPEINRFPDFPKINTLTPETTDYLLYKLERKKREYGYKDWTNRRFACERNQN